MKWSYWRWLTLGLIGKPGWKKFLDWWLLGHAAAAFALTHYSGVELKEAATTLMLPLASIFVGLSFAWAGNAQALLQTDEIESLVQKHPDGLHNYIYTFQTAILVILITLVAWGCAGLGIFAGPWFKKPFCDIIRPVDIVAFALFFLSSVTLRECWHVVLGSQMFILLRYKLKKTVV
jgi:hypothetical protein